MTSLPEPPAPSGRPYPEADRSEWYAEANYATNGGIMVMMPPAFFLECVRPLTLDDESVENILILRDHMLDGRTLDPLVIFDNGKEDGRHRAHAAMAAGVGEVPVILFGRQIERFANFGIFERRDPDTPAL